MRNRVKRIGVFSLTFIMLALLLSDLSRAEHAKPAPAPEAQGAAEAAVREPAAGGYRKAAENGSLALYVNPATLGIRVENRKSGYVWQGTLDEKDEKLNQTWQAFFESGLTIEYMDAKRKLTMAPVSAAKAQIALEEVPDGFSADVHYDKLGFRLKLHVRLTEDAVEFRVPADSIEETNPDNRLQTLHLYPFFGAAKGVQAEEGYMLIPDGSGALVHLNVPTLASQPYSARVYGSDLGIAGSLSYPDDLSLPPDQIYLPVYGIAREAGKNAFAALITGGAPYAEIRAYPSGVTTAYNWTTAKWIYRESYFQPTDKKGNGITLNMKDRNAFDAGLKLMFLSGEDADYSGMARRVQRELTQRGELPERKDGGADATPLVRLEVMMADHEDALIGQSVIPVTTVQDLDRMLEELRGSGAERLMVVVRGWSKGGATGASPSHFPFEGKAGSAGEWRAFIRKYEALGVPIYFLTDYVVADKSADGFSRGDIAKSINKQLISLYDSQWLLQPAASQALFRKELGAFDENGMAHIAMESIGNTLFSVHGTNPLAREASIAAYQNMLSGEESRSIALYRPNLYLWKWTDRILELPTSASGFLLETEQIPFLQLVLKGHAAYYAPASNFHSNPQEELLRLIDYGSGPSYFLTDEDPVKLMKTGSYWLYTSKFEVWKDQILQDYEKVAQALRPTAGAAFERREKVQDGVFRNRYSNGTVIYVNYNDHSVTVDGISVPAAGFRVKEGGGA